MLKAYVVGDLQVVANLRGGGSAVHEALLREMHRIVIELQNKVKAEKLSGQVLNVRTGVLRNSITQQARAEGPGIVEGIVGTNITYGAVHELGGPVNVPDHIRIITQAFGRTLLNPVEVNVRGHIRNNPQRSFLKSSLDEMAPNIRERLRQATITALRKK